MANVASAEKRNRQRAKRRARNLEHKTEVRTYVKRVRAVLDEKDPAKAQAALKIAVKALDQAAQRGVLRKQTAARQVSRLTLAVNRVSA